MAHPVIQLFEPAPGPFRFDRAPRGAPRPLSAIRDDIAAAARGSTWVVLGDDEPAAHPELEAVLEAVSDAGLRAKVTTGGAGLGTRSVLERLRDRGLAQLTVLFFGGTAATHDARVGRTGAFEEALEVVRLASGLNRLFGIARLVLLRDNHREVGALVEAVRGTARRFELVRLSSLTADAAVLREHGVPRAAALEAVQTAWEAARVTHLPLVTEGFASWPAVPGPSDAPLQPADGTLLELLRANVPVPSVVNGTWATPANGDVSGLWQAAEASRGLHELGLQLAAYGCPALDLPPQLGGLGLDFPPDEEAAAVAADRPRPRRSDGVPALLARNLGDVDARPLPAWTGVGRNARVAVIAGCVGDNVLVGSTLPALASALAARGADVTFHSVWDAPLNPCDDGVRIPEHDFGPRPGREGWRYPRDLSSTLGNTPQRIAQARRLAPGFVRSLDLSGLDLVVVAGFADALDVLTHPTLPDHARLVVADFHLMSGIGAWHERFVRKGARPMDGGWWPDERVIVHALYPRYVRAYWRAGVPLRQVRWRPYPVHLGHFPPGPDVTACDTIFAGGAHQRDWRTLATAAQRRRGGHPIRVHAAEPVPAPLIDGGNVRLLAFYESLANSRFVVLPLDPDPRKPAGISVVSLALAAGRPVVASSTLATLDHLRHGRDAILVPPGDPDALADALDRLDGDDASLARLAEGARARARHVSVDAWAEELLDGAPARTVWSQGEDPRRGPFCSWP